MEANNFIVRVEPSVRYDYIFCGTGASASLLLLELERNNLLLHKRVLLIDPENKNRKDKTFCFWSTEDEPITQNLNPLISKSWDTIAHTPLEQLSLSPLSYNHVDSIDLYHKIQSLAEIHHWDKIVGYVTEFAKEAEETFVVVNSTRIAGQNIFDSRPPVHQPAQSNEVHIYQSFIGWIIETESAVLNPDVFKFMDFNIAQQGSTQFVYVLPFSSNKALVEVTRFGSNQINTTEAEEILKDYILNYYGNYKILDVERGSIPMSNTKIESETTEGVINLGARNYNIKPSTGYAFKNMYYQALAITETLKSGGNLSAFNKDHHNTFKGRFAFYDALLLDILKNNPSYGKPIFIELLKKVETKTTLKFLDEQTNLIEEISIFLQLPWKPFLQALFKKIISTSWVQPLILLGITLLFVLLNKFAALQNLVGYALFFIGMVAVGIPHGAVDHLLETGNWDLKKAPIFVLKYLFLAALMGLIWYFLPSLALIGFLVYSSWHFGQADGKKWRFNPLTSLLWGASVLAFILGTHLDEANTILVGMGNISLPFNVPVWALLPWMIWALFRKQTGFVLTLIWLSLSSQIPLMLSFGLYFIGQHSLTSWKHLQLHLKISNKIIWLQSLPFHLGAWLILGFFYFFWPLQSEFNQSQQWGIFFIFIACISFPHVIAMHGMYRKQ